MIADDTPNDAPELMDPFSADLDLDVGALGNADHLIRTARDMTGYYADPAALARHVDSGDPVHYEVFSGPVPEKAGQLRYCISKLQPGLVGDECFMTKGHYHDVRETAEVYVCLRGRGCMLMKTPDGRCVAEEMTRGKLVYVPPGWAHRSVNTGDEPLISFCVYPGHAGHDYDDIEDEGFPKRVFKRNGRVVIE